MKSKRTKIALRRAGGGHGPTKHGKHTTNPGYHRGQHWVECQRCGLDYIVAHIKTQWDGLITCLSCWEPRHPQDFVRGIHDDIRAKHPVNPEPGDFTFINKKCPVTAVAGVAIAGCARAGQGFSSASSVEDSLDNPADVGSPYSTFNLETL